MNRESERKRLVEKLDEMDLFLRNRASAKETLLNEYDIGIMQECAKVADEAARMLENAIVPPVKVNTFAYFFSQNEVQEGYFERITIDKNGMKIVVCYDGIQFKVFKPCDIGKTVFMTREEAERKMKGEEK